MPCYTIKEDDGYSIMNKEEDAIMSWHELLSLQQKDE